MVPDLDSVLTLAKCFPPPLFVHLISNGARGVRGLLKDLVVQQYRALVFEEIELEKRMPHAGLSFRRSRYPAHIVRILTHLCAVYLSRFDIATCCLLWYVSLSSEEQ